MIYVRKIDEHVFTPVHLSPPTVNSLAIALAQKYNIDIETVTEIYRQSAAKGYVCISDFNMYFIQIVHCSVTVKVDDNMVEHYSNEDTYAIHVDWEAADRCSITLVELPLPDNSST
jgi:hypothetical protein